MQYKNIETQVVFFKEFKKISERFTIPSLQRPYVWETKKHVKKFLDDIYFSKKEYFIGSIVLINSTKGTAGREEIIDGQQRITTIFLILITIREIIKKSSFNSNKKRDILSDISDFISKIDSYDGIKELKLKFYNQISDNYFKAIENKGFNVRLSSNDIEKTFYDNFMYIKGYMDKKSGKELLTFFDKIQETQMIGINCLNNDIAYDLFESINATGLSLANVDLIKNFIFKEFKDNPKDLKLMEEYWLELEDAYLENRDLLKKFLRHDWISKGVYISASALYKKVSDEYKSSNDKNNKIKLKKYVDGLKNDGRDYLNLRKFNLEALNNVLEQFPVENDKKQIKELLRFLSFLNVDQVYAPILYFYRDNIKIFKKILVRLVAFQYLYKYVPGSPSSAEKIFSDMGNDKKNSNINMLFKKLEKLVGKQNEIFVDKFLEKVKYKQGLSADLQFVLERYVISKGGARSFKEPTIEHIIDQSIREIDIVGNLTVLEKPINTSMPKKIEDKKKKYEASVYKEHSLIIDRYDFLTNPDKSIKRRGEDIAEDVYNIFLNMLRTGKYE